MGGRKGPPFSVFVGNIAYEATDEQMRQLFSEVGPCCGFRRESVKVMCDKDTNKPKGYGFADYMDANLMDAAVRLLNGRDVHGRPIRVDFADHSDRERIRGPPGPNAEPPVGQQLSAVAAVQMASVLAGSGGAPDGPAADAITKRLSEMPPAQMYDLMGQVKVLVQADPQGTRQLLLSQPQFARTLFQMQIILGMLRAPEAGGAQGPGMAPPGPGVGVGMGPGVGVPPPPPGVVGGFPPPGGLPPPPQVGLGGFGAPQMGMPPQQAVPGGVMPQMGGVGMPPPGFMQGGGVMMPPGPGGMPFGVPQQQPVQGMQPGGFAPGAPGMWGPPPPQQQQQFGAPPQQQGGFAPGALDPTQQALLNQVMQLSPEQINALPEDQRQQVLQLLQVARQRGMQPMY